MALKNGVNAKLSRVYRGVKTVTTYSSRGVKPLLWNSEKDKVFDNCISNNWKRNVET